MVIAQVRGWVGAGLADAVGRLVILSGVTAYLARALQPGDFGTAALVLSVVTLFAVCVGTPYEEALAQRKVTRRSHLEAALAASLLTALALTALSALIGQVADHAYGQDGAGALLPGAAAMLFAQGPLSIATAVARRRREFYAIHVASLVGHGIGAAFACALALGSAGIWALIGLRVGIVVANALMLMLMLRLSLTPRWSWRIVSELNSFALFILITRVLDNVTYLIYNVFVGSLFGLTVLGYANMAMRLIEPIRGALIAVTHNLSFSFLMTLTRDPARLGEETRRLSAESTWVVAPLFLGLAAVCPILVPALAGPGWDEAVPIAMMLALGGMMAMSSLPLVAALSAAGRPKRVVHANLAGLATMALTLVAAYGRDPVFVGIARAANDLTQTLFLIVVGGPLVALPRRALLRQLAGSWAAAGAMALAVSLLVARLGGVMPPLAALPIAVASGVALYGLIQFVFARETFRRLVTLALRRPSPALADGSAK